MLEWVSRNPRLARLSRSIRLRWAASCIVAGLLVGYHRAASTEQIVRSYADDPMMASVSISGEVMGLDLALVMAFFQWLLLRMYVPAATRWVVATGVGALSGMFLIPPQVATVLYLIRDLILRDQFGMTLPDAIDLGLFNLISHLPEAAWIGLFQHLVLNGEPAGARPWIGASVAGWGLAYAILISAPFARPGVVPAWGWMLIVGAAGLAYALPTARCLDRRRARWLAGA